MRRKTPFSLVESIAFVQTPNLHSLIVCCKRKVTQTNNIFIIPLKIRRLSVHLSRKKRKNTTMTHRLNTNKQFMIGNGILAFAVIFVVVLFVYMSMRLQNDENRRYAEHYTVSLVKGFEGDSVSIYLNDSLLLNKTIDRSPFDLEVRRFAEESALMIVDNATEKLSLFELSEKGGTYRFEKEGETVKQLPQE